jgi:predicted DNA binding CopG/RHH family protein
MKEKIKYTEAPADIKEALRSAKPIKDFLPSPDQLVMKDSTRKVTLALTEESLAFFKKVGQKRRVPYQQLIRRVLDEYSKHYKGSE